MIPGLHLNSIRLRNVLLFKDVEFKFVPGLSVIYGLNQASARTSRNGNAAGKSAIFSQVGETLYENPIVGEKQDALKDGTRTLSMTVNGKRQIVIERAGSKLDVIVDGKSRFRTKPKARKWLSSSLPISEEEYNTYVHLDARIPHPLVMGTSSERKKFFTSFFALDKIDIERKLFQAELTKLGKVRAAYNEVRKEYLAAKERLLPLEKSQQLKTEVKILKSELDDLMAKNTRLQTITQLLTFEKSAAADILALRLALPDGIHVEAFDELYQTTKQNLKDDKADLEQAEAYIEYKRDTRHYQKAYEALSPDAKKLLIKLGAKKARFKCGSASDSLMHLDAQILAAESGIRKAQSDIDKPLPKLPKSEVTESKKELTAGLESLEHQYEHAKKFKAGNCETCGQEVKIKDPKKIKERIQEVEKKLEIIAASLSYSEASEARHLAEIAIIDYRKDLEEAKTRHKKTKRYADLLDEFVNLPKKPQAFDGKKLDAEIKRRMVDEDEALLRVLKFLRPNLDAVIQIEKLTDKQRAASVIADKLQVRINIGHERLSKVNAQLEVDLVVRAGVKRLLKRLKEMKVDLADEPALRLLVDSCSDKGAKRMAIKTISNRLMTEVNKYARFVFPEDYDFSFQWEKSQLAMMVKRKHGKKNLTSDVRKLSGAESKLFTIVLVLALLTFVPLRKRCNVMILDEPASTFSLETLAAFKTLLPILLKIIPTIVLITPRSDERYEEATEFTVVKTKSSITIRKGHPSQIKISSIS